LTVRLTDDANSYVIADAVYVTAAELPLALDDGGSGYTDSGWTLGLGAGYRGDYRWMSSGDGSQQAEWTLLGLEAGAYEVYATWLEGYNRATDAPYEIVDGDVSEGTVRVNQRPAPNDLDWDGQSWESLGTFTVDNATLRVRLTNDANNYVIADAIYVVPAGGGASAETRPLSTAQTFPTPMSGDIELLASLADIHVVPDPRFSGPPGLATFPHVPRDLGSVTPADSPVPGDALIDLIGPHPGEELYGELLVADALREVRSSQSRR
jgi:hypothetical protein